MQLNQKDLQGSLVSLQRAHDLRPEDPEITYHLALTLEDGGNRTAARAMMKDAISRGGFADLPSATAVG